MRQAARFLIAAALLGAALLSGGFMLRDSQSAQNGNIRPTDQAPTAQPAPAPSSTPAPTPQEARGLAYVALGDSSVFGMGASSPERSYVGQVSARLRAIYPEAETTNLGLNGATAADVVARQLAPAVAAQPQLVTLSVGPNDILQGRSPDQFERDLTTIFGRLDAETDAIVVVNLLPDLGVLPFLTPQQRALAGEVTRGYNQALRSAAEPFEVSVVDLYGASRRVVPAHPEVLSSDYFHPSDEGYARWADLMWSSIEPALPPR